MTGEGRGLGDESIEVAAVSSAMEADLRVLAGLGGRWATRGWGPGGWAVERTEPSQREAAGMP